MQSKNFTKNRTAVWQRLAVYITCSLLLFIPTQQLSAQALSSYTFSASTGTFTPVTGGTVMALSGGSTNNGFYNGIPIGFAFNYNNNVYVSAGACTNGFLSLVGTMTSTTANNNISTGAAVARPLLIPFWDDHDGAGMTFTYKSELVGADSVFTAEWLNVDWQFQGGPVLSFQVKLYKNTGAIQFIYRQESTPPGGGNASIGITSSGTGAGNYRSLSNSSASPAVSSTTATNNISSLPATDQVYQFIPPAPAVPVVFTGTKTNITSWGVTVDGTVAPNSFPIVTASGMVIGTLPNPQRTDPGVIDSANSPVLTSGSFSKNFTGLANATVYYYRTYAENSVGISYGPDSSFTTNLTATVPAVQTMAAFDIGYIFASPGGRILNDGGATITATGLVFGTSSNPAIGDPGVTDSMTATVVLDPDGYNFDLTTLAPSTKYYFRAYGINSVGTGYSVQDSFTTDPPIVTTGVSTFVTTIEANLSGEIRTISGPGDNSTITTSGFVVSTLPDPAVGGPGVIDSTTNPFLVSEGTYDLLIGGLTNSTLYHYRAYATNPFGTFYGADNTFTTNATAIIPSITMGGAGDVAAYSANIGGKILSNGGDPITASGNVYGTTPMPALGDPGVVDSTTTPVTTSGKYAFTIEGLTPSTKYYFRAYATNAVGTAYSAQDSFVTEPVITAFPYSENFDGGGVTGWNAVDNFGAPNDWVLGTPSKSTFTSAFTAPNAWVTKLTGDYSTSHDASVISPQLDFTTFTGDPLIRFKHRFIMEPCCDGGFLEVSINNGAWTRVEDMTGTGSNFNTPDAIGWYNAANGQGNCWSENSNLYATNTSGWITSMVAIPGAAGEANVKVRFTFVSDGSVEDEGWEIDNIEIFEPSAPIIAAGISTNITTSQATLNGNVLDDGGSPVTSSGVVYAATPAPIIGGPGVVDSTTNPVITQGPFSIDITGLALSTTYYYRAYATNAVGTSYSADSVFTTNATAVAPYISLIAPADIAAFTTTLGGNITSDGGDPVTASGVVYGTSSMPATGGPGVVDSVTVPAVTSGSFTIGAAGLTPATKYYVRAYAINTIGTGYSAQDSFVTAPVISTFPHSENFDGPAAGWSSAANFGAPNDWVMGTPAKSVMSAAFTAPNAWVTKLTGDYSTSHDGSVISPQCDFTSFTTDPVLRFKHRFMMESCCDGGFLEMSINNGAWVRVEDMVGSGSNFNTTNAKGWYNSSNAQGNCWSDMSSSYTTSASFWITSLVALPGAAGESNVRFRFTFVTDGSVEDEGWEIDNVELFEQVAPIVAAGSPTNITMNLATLDANIIDDGGSAITASGIVYSTTPAPVIGGPGVADSTTNPVVTNGPFSMNVSGLTLSTTYYYRAYAINAVGTSYSADSTFTTNAAAIVPYISNIAADPIGTSTATLGGNITSDGGDPVTASGIIYSTSPAPVLGGPGVVDSATAPAVTFGTFGIDIGGLTHSTTYYYRAYAVNTVGAGYGAVDSFITSPIVSTFPYMQNFDGTGNTGWASQSNGGAPNDWVLGSPAKTLLSGAFSGTKAWVTKLTGDYSTSHDASVVSPQFDFTGFTNDPVVRFKHRLIMEPCCDGGMLEMSINGGPWVKIENTIGSGDNFNTPAARSWYNTGAQGNSWSDISTLFSSNASGWISSQVALPGAAGQSNIKFRLTFITDGSVEEEGWEIDDIEVLNIAAPTVQATSVILSGLTNTSTDVSWTNGNGEARIVVARLTTTAAVDPSNLTEYTADASFGAGSITGADNFVVYNGTGSSVTVTELALLTNYTFTVYEYNGSFMHNRFILPGASNAATTLPVALISFTGNTRDKDVVLSWATASENNNKGFEVERSADGRSFEYISFVKGAGNSNSKLTYGLTDTKAFEKTNSSVLYYRLRQVDMDGKFAYSGVVRVTGNTQQANALSVHPNPFSTAYNVSLNAADAGTVRLKMVDLQGRIVAEQTSVVIKGLNEISFSNLQDLQAGIYFVKVTVDGETQVLKLVKN
jgi:hypothetical protein